MKSFAQSDACSNKKLKSVRPPEYIRFFSHIYVLEHMDNKYVSKKLNYVLKWRETF